jgi:Ca2+-binding RTX toxin-like protein
LIGWAGDDTINGVDGVNGNDTLKGSGGTDTCVADPSDVLIHCE